MCYLLHDFIKRCKMGIKITTLTKLGVEELNLKQLRHEKTLEFQWILLV